MKTSIRIKFITVFTLLLALIFLYGCNKSKSNLTGDMLFSEIETSVTSLNTYSFETDSIQLFHVRDAFIKPIYFRNSEIIVGLKPLHDIMGGYPAYIKLNTGRVKNCVGYLYDSIIKDPRTENEYQVIVIAPMMIHAYDLKECEITEKIFDSQEYSAKDEKLRGVSGATMIDTGELLYFGLETELCGPQSLMKMDTRTGEVIEIEQGIYPSLSHDNQMLAFIKENSLALLDLETGDIKIAHNFKGVVSSFGLSIDWSPDDSQLLVQVIDDSDDSFFEGSMYVYDLETEEFSRVNEKGVYPSWIN